MPLSPTHARHTLKADPAHLYIMSLVSAYWAGSSTFIFSRLATNRLVALMNMAGPRSPWTASPSQPAIRVGRIQPTECQVARTAPMTDCTRSPISDEDW